MPRSPRTAIVGLTAAALVGCGSAGYAPTDLHTAPSPPAPGASVTVPTGQPLVVATMRRLAFRPATIRTTVGRGVEWINRDSVAHNVTTLDGATIASPDLAPGRRFVFVPARTGRLRYYCTIHPSTMSGILIVAPA